VLFSSVGFLEMKLIDKQSFEEEYWFPPYAMVLYLALLWDSSDNIPWIKGIGRKTAQDIVKKYHLYEDLEKNITNLPENIQNKLKNNLEQLKYNIKLIQLMYPWDFSTKDIEINSNIKNINFDKLKDILVNQYWFDSFDSLINKIKKELKKPVNISLF